jgi:hypothetical protein
VAKQFKMIESQQSLSVNLTEIEKLLMFLTPA